MFSEIIKKIDESKKIAIYTHVNPDGDALGSAFGLKTALIEMGKEAEVFPESIPHNKEYSLLNDVYIKIEENECDLKIAVDSADISRLGGKQKNFSGNTIAIDHHVTHIPYAAVTVVDEKAASCGEMIFSLLKQFKRGISKITAHNLYMAIISDTGMFRYSNVTSSTHRIAAELIDTGVDFANICKLTFDTFPFQYYNLMKTAIDSINLYCDGRIAVMTLTEQDFTEAAIDETTADAIVNLPRSIENVEVGVYIRERYKTDKKDSLSASESDSASKKANYEKKSKEYKVSLRSNEYVDVSVISQNLGGGGHVKASGYSARGDLNEIIEIVVSEIEKQLK